MKIKKFKIILSLFLIIGIAAGGVLGYYDARLEAAVNNKNGSTLTDVKVDDNLTFNKNVINILLVGSDHGAIKGDHGRSDSIMIATVNFKTKELKLTSLMRDMYVEIPGHGHNKLMQLMHLVVWNYYTRRSLRILELRSTIIVLLNSQHLRKLSIKLAV